MRGLPNFICSRNGEGGIGPRFGRAFENVRGCRPRAKQSRVVIQISYYEPVGRAAPQAPAM
jgi:hypothetical protein